MAHMMDGSCRHAFHTSIAKRSEPASEARKAALPWRKLACFRFGEFPLVWGESPF